MSTPDPISYQSYKGLPPLAGLATLAEAARPGLGIEECVTRLKRFHYSLVRLHDALADGEPQARASPAARPGGVHAVEALAHVP